MTPGTTWRSYPRDASGALALYIDGEKRAGCEGTGQVVDDMSLAGNDGFLGETPQVDNADPIWEGAPVSVEDESIHSDRQMVLAPNYPNPFNPTTQIMFSLPTDSDIRLVVFDVLGRAVQLLAKGRYKAGTYTVTANMKNFTSGLYLYQLDTRTGKLTGKMLLIK